MEDTQELKKLRAAVAQIKAVNKAQAAKTRQKKQAAGYRQVNIWMTDTEAEMVKRFLQVSRAETGECRVYKKSTIDGKWLDTGIFLGSPS